MIKRESVCTGTAFSAALIIYALDGESCISWQEAASDSCAEVYHHVHYILHIFL
jgi:hypothetical protein